MGYQAFLILSIFFSITHYNTAVPNVFPADGTTSDPVVHTRVGSIRGLRAEDGNYSMFMGIPYAQVDSENPFGTSTPYPNFESTFDAFDDSAICPQQEEFNYTIVGSLDCLHINVYVPDSASDENRLPVLVWIFGGGFSIGFAGQYVYGPSFLVRHDVIFVTFNYRLGPYGFMCLDIPEVPGNQGLKDQVLALRWVRDNIGSFGGDNNKITIAGNSAGGMAADFHLYYGEDENLFQKFIPQSGTLMVTSTLADPDPATPLQLAEFLNHTSNDVKDALSFLASVDPHQLIAVTLELGTSFGPCIENEFEDVNRFITEHPINMDIPRVKDIEVLIGFNNDEMYSGLADLSDDIYQRGGFVELWLNIHFDFENEEELYADMVQIVTNFYFGDEDMGPNVKREIIDLGSDFSFNHPVLRSVKKYLDNGVHTLYLYLFSYSGGRNFSKYRLNLTEGGAAHADELGYLFDISYMEKPLNAEDQLIVDRMTELWTNFVKYGNPTPEPTELVPVTWQPVTQDMWHYLDLDTNIQVSTRPMHARMAFLDLFYKKNKIHQRGYIRDDSEPSSGRNLALDISLPVIFILMVFCR